MRWVGMLLFLAGIGLAGVYASRPAPVEVEEGESPDPAEQVSTWWSLAGWPFTAGAVMMVLGGLVARRDRGATTAAGGHAKDEEKAPALVRRIRERLDEVPEDARAEPEKAKQRLDEVIEDLIPRVLDRREAMIARMGLGDFAEMIGHFAQMERNAARAWSCLIDEAYDEIPACLERARDGADRALERLER
ncbi:MAG TPA: hypothetical protein RMH99_13440 [Sandaracinaceae bacterium LLY-WYZ-13_1]|nr:hypothetical protein [Sandaracinaceae bacterium LLY-WYZ-13_1]